MRATADLLEAEADPVAAMMTLEMGKTLVSAKAEAMKCVAGMRYYAEHAEEMLTDEVADAAAVGAGSAFARYQPLGWCWRSCRGTSHCGRSSGSPPRP
jgi:succinate-semialdehyde dehydrogenase / glutarate-semialdehyde dehydrogenase